MPGKRRISTPVSGSAFRKSGHRLCDQNALQLKDLEHDSEVGRPRPTPSCSRPLAAITKPMTRDDPLIPPTPSEEDYLRRPLQPHEDIPATLDPIALFRVWLAEA